MQLQRAVVPPHRNVHHPPVAVLVHDQPGVGNVAGPDESAVVQQPHHVRIVLQRAATHEPLRDGPLVPVAALLPVELAQVHQHQLLPHRHLPQRVAHDLHPVMDLPDLVHRHQLQVVHDEVPAVVVLHMVRYGLYHICQAGNGGPVDQQAPPALGVLAVDGGRGAVVGGQVELRPLLQHPHRLAAGNGEEAGGQLRAPHFQRQERHRLAVRDGVGGQVEPDEALARPGVGAARHHPGTRQPDAAPVAPAQRVELRQRGGHGVHRSQLLVQQLV